MEPESPDDDGGDDEDFFVDPEMDGEDGAETPDDEQSEDDTLGGVGFYVALRGAIQGALGRQRAGGQNLPVVPPMEEAQPLQDDDFAMEITKRTAPMRFRNNSFTGISSDDVNASHRGGFVNSAKMVFGRESERPPAGGFTSSERSHIRNRFIPGQKSAESVDTMRSRGYVGKFSRDGSKFVAGFQERFIRVYDVCGNWWQVRKDITARDLRWTITDTALSGDGSFLVYTSITPWVHLVGIGGEQYSGTVESISNVTDIHECLDLCYLGDDETMDDRFGVWSCKISPGEEELIAGTSDAFVSAYDLNKRKTVARVLGHDDDVNAVAYAGNDGNVILSGSDDSTVKVWDRREMGLQSGRPSGTCLGHTEGLTHIDPHSDGIHFITNAKDQTCKLWDMRRMVSPSAARTQQTEARRSLPAYEWDYRWMRWPGEGYQVNHPYDQSLHTYRGHTVLATLIRCYWSPPSTGERYIYTGSHDGVIRIFDSVTGKAVRGLHSPSNEVIRDCAWHPEEPLIAAVSWRGEVLKFECGKALSDTESHDPSADAEKPSAGDVDFI